MIRALPFVVVGLLSTMIWFSSPASACEAGLTSRCETMNNQGYRGGGANPKVVPLTACLPNRLHESIKLQGGRSFWEAGFYYGTGKPEVVSTVKNGRCWTRGKNGARQHGSPGAYVVAFVCCDLYCGWTGAKIPSSGQVVLQPIVLPESHDPLRQYRRGDTGHYDQ